MSETIKWSALTPEQRDTLIAEKIMGWTPEPCDALDQMIDFSDGWYCKACGVYKWLPGRQEHNKPTPRYSQNMDTAWLILKHFSDWEEHYQFHEKFMSYFEETVSDRWDEDGLTFEGLALLTPEQICIATLKAVGCEVIE